MSPRVGDSADAAIRRLIGPLVTAAAGHTAVYLGGSHGTLEATHHAVTQAQEVTT